MECIQNNNVYQQLLPLIFFLTFKAQLKLRAFRNIIIFDIIQSFDYIRLRYECLSLRHTQNKPSSVIIMFKQGKIWILFRLQSRRFFFLNYCS